MEIFNYIKSWISRKEEQAEKPIKDTTQKPRKYITGIDVVKEAKTWIGTPYHHQAGIKNVGVDCAMLIFKIAEELHLVNKGEKLPAYTTQWHRHKNEEMLIDMLKKFGCKEIPISQARIGDLYTFRFGKAAAHMAIKSDNLRIIHTTQGAGKVVEVYLNGELERRLYKAFRMPGVM